MGDPMDDDGVQGVDSWPGWNSANVRREEQAAMPNAKIDSSEVGFTLRMSCELCFLPRVPIPEIFSISKVELC